jgi:adenylate cyclase
MAGEIFISYRRADEVWARRLHDLLRAEGIEAWYDAQVGAGQDWRIATAKALQASNIFVLLFTSNAAQSSDIAKELAAAVFEKKLIIPVRLEDIAPSGAFLYELASRNWVNAHENPEAKLAELAKGLAHLVLTGARDESVLPFDRSSGGQTPAPVRKSIRTPALIAAVVIALIAASTLAAWLLWPGGSTTKAPPGAVAGIQAPARAAGISIAVLPFLNLSSDKEQEFFSDGITEEITSALAKIPNLPVVGRTSAFAFKGKNEDLSAIGQALHATYLLEGSVRKAGDRVRITAQLIKAATGDHVWTDSYDRNLTDIFAVQEDVAKAIAAALQSPLGLKQGEALVSNRQIDPASYEDYLRAAALVRKRDIGVRLDVPIALLEGVVARQPNYAPAWALLANADSFAPLYDPAYQKGTVEQLRRVSGEVLPKAEAAARRAIQLDPHNADAYVGLGRVQGYEGKWLAAEQSFQQALNLDPLNPNGLHTYSLFLAATAQIKPAIAMREKLTALDPLVPSYNTSTSRIFLAVGDGAKALTIAQALPFGSGSRANALMRVYAATKRYKEAAASILTAPPGLYPPANVATAVRLLRMAPSATPRQDGPYLGELSVVFLYAGLPERALEVQEHNADAGFNVLSAMMDIWQFDFGAARKTERTKNLIRKLGLVDYWRAKGWPQFCHPIGTDNFVCT